jgi:single-strand DNA-binding protein
LPASRRATPEDLRVYGRLQGDPDLRRMPSGRPAASFTISVAERPSGPARGALLCTDEITVLACGELAESCRRVLRRGHNVCIEGRLRTRNLEDTQGRDQSRIELVATDLAIVGGDDPDSAGSRRLSSQRCRRLSGVL